MNCVKKCKLNNGTFIKEVMICVFGVLLGMLYFLCFKECELPSIKNIFDETSGIANNQIINVILHNAKFIFIIVFVSLLTKNNFLLSLLIGYKSFIYTVTLFNIAWKMNISGLKMALFIFLPFYVVYITIYIVLVKHSKEYIAKLKSEKTNEWIKYIVRILLSLLIIIALSIAEVECIVHLTKFFIN